MTKETTDYVEENVEENVPHLLGQLVVAVLQIP